MARIVEILAVGLWVALYATSQALPTAVADQTAYTNEIPPPSPFLRNGSFEEGHGGFEHSLYPWVKYTGGQGVDPIDGLVGPYPKNGTLTWHRGVQAYDGEYFVGAAANWGFKNGGVFQRVLWPPGRRCVFSARYITLNVGGIPYDTRVRLGIDPIGGTDPKSPRIRWWTAVSPTNDNRWHLGAITAVAGATGIVTVFIDIYQQWELEWHVAAVDHARLTTPLQTTIGALKASEGDSGVILTNKIITYADPSPAVCFDKCYYKAYVEEDNRSAGIAVYLGADSPETPNVGDRITLSGRVVQHNLEAVVIADEWGEVDQGNALPRPFGMSTKSIGGSTPIQPALFGPGGACNVGLRVRVFGRVTWVDSNSPYTDALATIDDGAGIIDQYPNLGTVAPGLRVRLKANSVYGVNVGDYVEATGVVAIEFIDPIWPPFTGEEYFAYTVLTHTPDDWRVTSTATTPSTLTYKKTSILTVCLCRMVCLRVLLRQLKLGSAVPSSR